MCLYRELSQSTNKQHMMEKVHFYALLFPKHLMYLIFPSGFKLRIRISFSFKGGSEMMVESPAGVYGMTWSLYVFGFPLLPW